MEEIVKKTEYIKNFSLGDCVAGNKGYKRVLLQLFGFTGHGKSSFINSCKYVLEGGKFKTYAKLIDDEDFEQGSVTKARFSYPLTDTMTLVDNRGCQFMNNYEMSEIFAQLGNLLPLDKHFEFGKESIDLTNRIIEAENEIKASDFLFPIFVYSVKYGVDFAEVEELKELLTIARDLTGIFPVIVLTHKLHPNLQEVRSMFQNMGAEQIFPLENFIAEDHLTTRGIHQEMLAFFNEVINDIKFRVGHFDDPEKQRLKRKTFVFKFLHEKEKKKKDEELQYVKQQHEQEKKKQQEELERVKQQHEREKKIEQIKAELQNIAREGETRILMYAIIRTIRERTTRERTTREREQQERERQERVRQERERQERERQERERQERERQERERQERVRQERGKKIEQIRAELQNIEREIKQEKGFCVLQ